VETTGPQRGRGGYTAAGKNSAISKKLNFNCRGRKLRNKE